MEEAQRQQIHESRIKIQSIEQFNSILIIVVFFNSLIPFLFFQAH